MARIPLSDIALEEDQVIVEGFEAELDGIRIWVTAVLERTCVYETPEMERRLVSKSKVLVEPGQVPIRRRRIGPPGADMKGKGKPAAKTSGAARKAAEEPAPEELVEEADEGDEGEGDQADQARDDVAK
jgi:hypothetical protein